VEVADHRRGFRAGRLADGPLEVDRSGVALRGSEHAGALRIERLGGRDRHARFRHRLRGGSRRGDRRGAGRRGDGRVHGALRAGTPRRVERVVRVDHHAHFDRLHPVGALPAGGGEQLGGDALERAAVDPMVTTVPGRSVTDLAQGSGDEEVDPLAEAEVYLSYGRDAQAEEILREAVERQPGRNELRMKLLEIY
ncbi:MAG: FimV family protein, partial [bacterium]